MTSPRFPCECITLLYLFRYPHSCTLFRPFCIAAVAYSVTLLMQGKFKYGIALGCPGASSSVRAGEQGARADCWLSVRPGGRVEKQWGSQEGIQSGEVAGTGGHEHGTRAGTSMVQEQELGSLHDARVAGG